MSEVKRYRQLVGEHPNSRWVQMVKAQDFDAERALRLEAERQVADLIEARDNRVAERMEAIDALTGRAENAERQVGELRRSLPNSTTELVDLRAKLDTAMELFREAEFWLQFIAERSDQDPECLAPIRNLLNTTSTEGKDHE